MSWRDRYRSFYYEELPELPDIVLPASSTALLIIDVQNTYLEDAPDAAPRERERWRPFRERMRGVVIPSILRLREAFRAAGSRVIYARIACLTPDGADRSLSQRRPGFNNLLLPHRGRASQIIPELAPADDEIVVCKTTDSALTGTNLRLILHNLGIAHVVATGIFTDQCVSSTVRSLADESFNVIVVDDACAAGTDELHRYELEILNNIYCQVLETEEVLQALARTSAEL